MVKFSFRAWLVWLLWKLSFGKIEKALATFGPRVLEDGMRQRLEKMSDKDIDEAIKDIKKGDWSKQPYASLIASIQKAGITVDMMLKWLETEKFLRDHRRKYSSKELNGS